MTKNKTFINTCADQFYRLEAGVEVGYNNISRLPATLGFSNAVPAPAARAALAVLPAASAAAASLRLVMVPPVHGYTHDGRLRLLTAAPVPATVQLTWLAWTVPPTLPLLWNNTIAVTLGPQQQLGGTRATDGGVSASISSSAGVVGRGPFNNTDLQPSATYYHSYKVFPNKTVGALACQKECDGDNQCRAWSYVVGHAGTQPAPGVERCCRHSVLGCPVPSAGVISGAKAARESCSGTVTLHQLQLSMPVGGDGCDS
eukprot:gene24105-13012_t